MTKPLSILALLLGFVSVPLGQAPQGGTDNLDLGIPGPCDQIIDREGYAVGYSRAYRLPMWVTYRLTATEASSRLVERMGEFKVDPLVVGMSASPSDYYRSGYDRGHLAPAADMHWSTNAMMESFYMSNMAPQTPMLNRKTWAYAEAYIRSCAIREGSMMVVSGPVITNPMPKRIGRGVAVPDAFYKVAYDESPPEKMIAFVIPNGQPELDIWLYATNVAYVEELTGWNFFCNVDTNKAAMLKARFDRWEWECIRSPGLCIERR